MKKPFFSKSMSFRFLRLLSPPNELTLPVTFFTESYKFSKIEMIESERRGFELEEEAILRVLALSSKAFARVESNGRL